MILVSRESVGSLCIVHLASSGSAWYALYTLTWWIQGVTPATLLAVGVVRTVYGPFQCGPPDHQAQIHESVPQGGMAHFLVQT